jgi:FixJ family two-component response regulator
MKAQSFTSSSATSRCGAPWRELLDAGEVEGVGCIVLDVRLPGMSGLDFRLVRLYVSFTRYTFHNARKCPAS